MNLTKKFKRLIAISVALSTVTFAMACGNDNSKETIAVSDRAVSVVSESLEHASSSSNIAESESVDEIEEEQDVDDIPKELRNRINILNYMTFLTQKINTEPVNKYYLEEAYAFYDNLNRAAVDDSVGTWVDSLWNSIKDYRLIEEGRHQVQVAYDQRRAEIIKDAIPNPANILNAAKSGNIIGGLISSAGEALETLMGNSSADQDYMEDSWKLSEEQQQKLHESLQDSFHRAIDMAKEYEIPEEYLLRDEDLRSFIEWSSKADEEAPEKLSWLEKHQDIYSNFCPYWLELAKSCHAHSEHEKCLDAVSKYETIATPIFLKDKDYAQILPIKVDSARNTLPEAEYVPLAADASVSILENTEDEDWELRYGAATTLYSLYSTTKDKSYLEQAYQTIYNNVVICVGEQRLQNSTYLEEVKERPMPENATDDEKKAVKELNKGDQEKRKKELPPIYTPLYVNGSMLFELAKELEIDAAEQKKIETLLHKDGERIILVENIDELFWFNDGPKRTADNEIDVAFEAGVFTVPASHLTDQFVLTATVEGNGGTEVFDDWTVTEVKREKDSKECSEFTVRLENKNSKDYKYEDGDVVTIELMPMKGAPVDPMRFTFNAVAGKKLFIFDDITFERAG